MVSFNDLVEVFDQAAQTAFEVDYDFNAAHWAARRAIVVFLKRNDVSLIGANKLHKAAGGSYRFYHLREGILEYQSL
jgi:hypothetical protein